MLLFSRKEGESIMIGDIEVTVTKIRSGSVKLGFNSGPDYAIRRGELDDNRGHYNGSPVPRNNPSGGLDESTKLEPPPYNT